MLRAALVLAIVAPVAAWIPLRIPQRAVPVPRHSRVISRDFSPTPHSEPALAQGRGRKRPLYGLFGGVDKSGSDGTARQKVVEKKVQKRWGEETEDATEEDLDLMKSDIADDGWWRLVCYGYMACVDGHVRGGLASAPALTARAHKSVWLATVGYRPHVSTRACQILHNDEVHTFEYVVEAIVKVVPQVSRPKAYAIARVTHQTGKATVTTVWKSLAEQMCMALQMFGLTMSVAPDDEFEDNNISGDDEDFDDEGELAPG